MASALVPLANLTLGSSQATVTFSSIPATYRDLRLVVQAPSLTLPVTTDTSLRFNADSGANYNAVRMGGNGSTATSVSGANLNQIDFPTDSTAFDIMWTIDIMDYSATDKHKTVLTRTSKASAGVWADCWRWASTSAITSMVFAGGDSGVRSFVSGSTFALYGIVS